MSKSMPIVTGLKQFKELKLKEFLKVINKKVLYNIPNIFQKMLVFDGNTVIRLKWLSNFLSSRHPCRSFSN